MLTLSDITSLDDERMSLNELIVIEAQLKNIVSRVQDSGRPVPRSLGAKVDSIKGRVDLKVRDMKKLQLAKLQAEYAESLPNDVKLKNKMEAIEALKKELGEE